MRSDFPGAPQLLLQIQYETAAGLKQPMACFLEVNSQFEWETVIL